MRVHFWTLRDVADVADWDPDADPGIHLDGFGHSFLEPFARLRDHSDVVRPTIGPTAGARHRGARRVRSTRCGAGSHVRGRGQRAPCRSGCPLSTAGDRAKRSSTPGRSAAVDLHRGRA